VNTAAPVSTTADRRTACYLLAFFKDRSFVAPCSPSRLKSSLIVLCFQQISNGVPW